MTELMASIEGTVVVTRLWG